MNSLYTQACTPHIRGISTTLAAGSNDAGRRGRVQDCGRISAVWRRSTHAAEFSHCETQLTSTTALLRWFADMMECCSRVDDTSPRRAHGRRPFCRLTGSRCRPTVYSSKPVSIPRQPGARVARACDRQRASHRPQSAHLKAQSCRSNPANSSACPTAMQRCTDAILCSFAQTSRNINISCCIFTGAAARSQDEEPASAFSNPPIRLPLYSQYHRRAECRQSDALYTTQDRTMRTR